MALMMVVMVAFMLVGGHHRLDSGHDKPPPHEAHAVQEWDGAEEK